MILKSRGQVAAGLSVTRSFGDVDFKVPAEVVTAVPELSAFAIDPEDWGRGWTGMERNLQKIHNSCILLYYIAI